jgi:hypothetical protein
MAKKPDDTPDFAPRPLSRSLAYRLSGGVEHSSLIQCARCQTPLVPVISTDTPLPEVVALACVLGHGLVPVYVGILAPELLGPQDESVS